MGTSISRGVRTKKDFCKKTKKRIEISGGKLDPLRWRDSLRLQ